ncbi:tetratricopeptide repeat protein [Fontisphaera persica]|uniref:tetratricopeptide repeat protein n=1 Tax=Fontisphaera persica TaxID=2974023 RepID=UPI0024BFFD9F|nr:tetratricopeptide repeat protein [Fontisphaera persica]WCJ60023.1 tetratricopeptide repeat protein [Fontisphaera persica]
MQPESVSWFKVAYNLAVLAVFLGIVGWLFWRGLRRSGEPLRLLSKWVITAVLLLGLIPMVKDAAGSYHAVVRWFAVALGLVAGLILALIWTPTIVGMVADWIGILYTGGKEEPVPEPVYSPARARRVQGQPEEALRLIRAELEKFPGDYTGQMMMAEIYAQDLADLQAAETCVLKVVHQTQHPPAARAFALFSLADWYLAVQKNREDAQRVLEMVAELLPDSEYALQAAQRLAHLRPSAELMEKEERRVIKVPEGRRDLGLRPMRAEELVHRKTPEEEAEELVSQLEKHPMDLEARERLAQVYGLELGRLDLAVEQLEQLVNCPHVAPKQVARWLQLLADLHLRVAGDTAAAEAALRRIIDLYPDSALARQAQENILRLPTHPARSTPATVRLGEYEQYLGLKKRNT